VRPGIVQATEAIIMKSLKEMSREELVEELELLRKGNGGKIPGRRFRLAAEISNDGLWEWDVGTGELYFSPRYFTMLGYEPDTFEHNLETWASLLHPEDRERARDEIFSSLERAEPFNVKYRMKNKRGEWQWILSRGRIVERNPDGSPLRLVGTHVDIHDQTVLTRTIRKQNEELTLLNRLGQSVARRLSLDDTVDAALSLLKRAVDCDVLVLFLLDGEKIIAKGIRSDIEVDDAFYEQRTTVGECMCARSVESGKSFFSQDVSEEVFCHEDDCLKIGVKSFASIPLVNAGTVLGVIGIGSMRSVDYSLRKDFLSLAASAVAGGIANSMMHEELKRHSEGLEGLVRERTKELAKLTNAIEKVSLSVIITDVKGTIEYVNPFFTELTGYSREEAIGQSPRMLKSGVHGKEFYRAMWKELMTGHTWRGEICNRKRDGSTYWERASISPLADDSGTITHFVAVEEDFTERREQEQELLILSKAIHNASSAVVVTDVHGHIVYVNPSFSELTGYFPEEAMGRNPRILKSGLHDDEFYRELWKTIASGKAWKGEILNRRKDGTRFWMAARIAPVFDAHGAITHYVGVQNDVTEKKELERLKEDVDRIMRHDLKTPLNGIIGFPQLIEMEGNLTEDQLELTRAITHSARKMLRMIDLSLDFFKMETGRYEYAPHRVDLLATLRELVADFGPKISAKRLTLRVTLDGEPVAEGDSFLILSEESLLYSMLSNLLTNAIEASPQEAEVSVALQRQGGCFVSIANSGAVPPAVRKTFFRKYHTSGKKGGTGLGTYSAKMIADAMGYGIRMETSDEESRTSLSIEIPEASCFVSEPENV
jgi:PAS domain S-box-containing protein